ncbi:MAG: nucleoside hydrolase [Bryobacterales bacterium]|nr:nucleoside hydrolase [Bryobacterales bacterium]
MHRVLFLSILAVTLPAQIPLIFDTDMGNDIDDALALAVIHSLESRGEARLLAVTITKDNAAAATYVDLVNHFYGRGHVPVGIVKNGPTPKASPYVQVPSDRKDSQGRLIYPRRLMDGSAAPDATQLLRSVLEAQPDQSTVVVQVGFSTNLARLLDQPGGADLIRRKVKLLSIMAGEFPSGKPEYNVRIDVPAFQKLMAQWPVDVVFSGFEIGRSIEYPAASIEADYRYVKDHPVAEAYRLYQKMPYDRPTWDLTSVLYAVRPDREYFTLSERGKVTADGDGKTAFQVDAAGKHRYLIVNDAQRAKTLEALIQLSSQPPRR